ncbi:CBS domain-containing protein [Rhodoblastus sp.]|uniref:CBS domain-containing protein n=1 Tax=Rhodoblastus sp. TaxID=1962975 RepID=UPI0035AF1781
MAVSIGEVLHRIGKPLIQASYHSSLQSLARLFRYSGVEAVLLIDQERRVIGVVTPSSIAAQIARNAKAETADRIFFSFPEDVGCCSAWDDLDDVAVRMFRKGHSVLLVNANGQYSATITLERLCDAMM